MYSVPSMNAYELDLQKAREIEPHYTWLYKFKVDKAERLITVMPEWCMWKFFSDNKSVNEASNVWLCLLGTYGYEF